MRTLLAAMALLVPASASAFGTHQDGIWIGANGLGALEAPPTRLAPGWQVEVGWWRGLFDDALFLGRYWGLGAAAQQSWSQGKPVTTVLVEGRRALDVAIIEVTGWAAAGVELAPGSIGPTVRLGGALKYRPRPVIGPRIGLEAGGTWRDGEPHVDVVGTIGIEVFLHVHTKGPK